MATQTPDLSTISKLSAFASANPDFDIVHADLLDPTKVSSLDWTGIDEATVLPELQAYQRLLRLDPDVAIADTLYDAGMDSARRITSLSRSQFIARFAELFGHDGRAIANRVYAAAIQAKNRAMHLTANVHGVVASAHSRALAGANVSDSLPPYFQALSSYQTIFGNLDYCECRECASIFAPSAYLVDLLRIIDMAITVPNTSRPDPTAYAAARDKYDSSGANGLTADEHRIVFEENIPPGLTLNDRRPDIGRLELTCANTSDEEPYLDLVNKIVAKTVSSNLEANSKLQNDDLWLTLANSYFPFNLPFNLPLAQIRTYLEKRGTTLYQIFSALSPTTAPTIEVSRERLQISPNQLANIEPQKPSELPSVLSKNYGLTITATSLNGLDHLDTFEKQTGLRSTEVTDLFLQNLSTKEIFDVTGDYKPSAWGDKMILMQTGERVTGTYDDKGGKLEGTIRDRVLLGHWIENDDSKGNIEFTFAANGSGFTGKWSDGYGGAWEKEPWNGTRDASTPATGGIIPHAFFINKVLPVRTYLHVETQGTAPHTYAGIAEQSLETLDTINRFLRLAKIIGWTYADLNWMLTTLHAPKVDADGNLENVTSLDASTIIELAKIKQLQDEYDIPLDLLSCLWFDLRTIGVGNTEFSQAPFDQIFNNPQTLAQFPGNKIYHPIIPEGTTSYVNPLYRDTAYPWTVPKQGAQGSPAPAPTGSADIIIASIPASADDIDAIAIAAFGAGNEVELTVPRLSLLYRHTALARHLGLTADAYLRLLTLLGLRKKGFPDALDRDQILKIVTAAKWIAASSMNVFEIDYVCELAPSPYVSTGYDPKAIPSFLNSLAEALKSTLVQPGLFVSQDIDDTASAAYVVTLTDQGFLDPLGIVLGDAKTKPPDLSKVTQYAPTVGVPTTTQMSYVVSKLESQKAAQLSQLAAQVASFFGVSSDLMTVLLRSAARWRQTSGAIEPFLLDPLFDTPASTVLTGDMLDASKLAPIFATHHIALSDDVVVNSRVPTTWHIDDSAKADVFQGVSPNLQAVEFYRLDTNHDGTATLLFVGAAADLMTDGALDLTKVKTMFAAEGIKLSDDTSLSTSIRSHAWNIVDRGNKGVNYWATEPLDGSHIAFSRPIIEDSKSSPLPTTLDGLFNQVSQFLVLKNGLSLSQDTLGGVLDDPKPYGIDDTAKPIAFTLDAVHHVYEFLGLQNAFQDDSGRLRAYFEAVARGELKTSAEACGELCKITGWDLAQCEWLCQHLLSDNHICTSVAELVRLKRVFDIASALDSSVDFLNTLYGLRDKPADKAKWAHLQTVASRLLQAVRSNSTAEAWPTVFDAINAPIEEAKRDALVPMAIWLLSQHYEGITTPNNLYEFLLIDVEMSGCATISPLKEALNAAQLYLQRCRLNLEINVSISTDDLPDVWWEWLMNYRVWEANREIFLYPENYIDPTLRKSKSKLFSKLENDLLQGQLTKEKVDATFRHYLDGVDELAKLRVVDAYHATVHDATKGSIDTLFLFSRTGAQPGKFYLASRETLGECAGGTGQQWSQWEEIAITINSPYLTPVYAFKHLYVFWVELTQKKDQSSGSTPKKYAITTAAIKYSYRNFTGNWMQPQTLIGEQVIDVRAVDSLYGPFADTFDNSENLFWHKVQVLCLPADIVTAGERIVVQYGPFLNGASPTSDNDLPDPASFKSMPEVQEFLYTLTEAKFVQNQLNALSQVGRTPLLGSMILDQELETAALNYDNQYTLLQPNTNNATTPPYFSAGLNGPALALQTNDNSLYDNYVQGMGLETPVIIAPGAIVTDTSFISSTIDAALSKTIFHDLTTPPNDLIDTNGKVKKSATTTPYTMLKALLGMSDAIVRSARETLFEYYYGTPVLFSKVESRHATVIPVKNQPGSLIFRAEGEAFLVDAVSTEDAHFAMLDTALSLSTGENALTPEAFASRDIDEALSRHFWKVLTKSPNNVIDSHGKVDKSRVESLAINMLALALQTDDGRAQEVKNTLLSGFGPASVSYRPNGFQAEDTLFNLRFAVQRLSTSAMHQLSDRLYAGGVDELLALPAQQAPVNIKLPFDRLGPMTQTAPPDTDHAPVALVPPKSLFGDQVSFEGPYGDYYWELFFHAPFLVAKMLHDDQQFEAAERWLQYIFNPTLSPQPLTKARFLAERPEDVSESEAEHFYTVLTTPPNSLIDTNGKVASEALTVQVALLAAALQTGPLQAAEIKNLLVNNYLVKTTGRYWQFAPFRNHSLESLKDQLQNCAEIAAYNDEPFDPHAIARLRIGAYEKTIVMYYIENLLDWGDSEFSKYTWESITTARMLYVYAADLLGPRPEDVGPCDEQFPVTFDDILARYKGDPSSIPQFLIMMENAAGGGVAAGPMLAAPQTAYNDLGGYFCIPENSQLTGYWDRVDDRLYKIRHCLNILGEKQPLPLFQPPINPADLVRAAASGNNVLGVVDRLQPLIPNYRFVVLVERARAAIQMVVDFGRVLLQTLEKKDAEALALLRGTHEINIQTMVTTIKQKSIEDLQKQQEGLNDSLQSAQYRVNHYTDLINKGLNAGEIANFTLISASMLAKGGAIPFHGLAIAGYLAPDIFGLADGGMKFGDAINAGAQIANVASELLSQSASIAQIAGEQARRKASWEEQRQLARYDVQQLNAQIASIDARIAGAQQDLAVNHKQIEQSKREQDFLKTKFTNEELYQWMISHVSASYFQAYHLAQELAIEAQTAYQFELDRDDAFVTFGYWDNLHQGLLAGEGLQLALARLEKAYLDHDDRRLEIEKTISVRQHFPEAFFGFKWGYRGGDGSSTKGQLDLNLSEQVFDKDFPSQYCRKIKSISVSLPSVVGPYQDIHATLTQTRNTVLLEPNPAAVDYLIWQTSAKHNGQQPDAPAGGVLRENWVPNQRIAVSRGIDDSGLFVLDFRDERYLPFEGTGAVSSWTFSMPPETNTIDFDAISDVIIKVRYTAKEGGRSFGDRVKRLYSQTAPQYQDLNSTTFTLAEAFAGAWHELFQTPVQSGKQSVTFHVPANAVLPNLAPSTLEAVLVQLQPKKDGVKVDDPGSGSFLTLQVDGKPSHPISIPIKNNFGELGSDKLSEISHEFTGVDWVLSFDLANTPTSLKTDNALDRTKLEDLAVVIVYKAQPFGR